MIRGKGLPIRSLLVCLSLVLAGCQSTAPQSAAVEPESYQISPASVSVPASAPAAAEAFRAVPEYRIGVDDLVLVSVWGNENLTIQVPVRPDGRISVPLIGDVEAGGKTPSEVSRTVEQALAEYVRDPKVSVILIELRSHEFVSRVRVTGAVRSPLSVAYRQGMTVLDLVLLAGGVNEFAAPGRARLYRRHSGEEGPTVLDVDLDGILTRGKLDTNYTLIPGDVVTVPERLF